MESRPKLDIQPKVLCIDNNTNSQRLISQMLASDFDVKTTGSGPSCIKALCDFAPDAILLDVDLPNFDSFNICTLIRAESDFTKTPILFLSQMGTQNEHFKGFQAGGDDYIQKPLSPEQLKEKITQSLQRAQKNTSLARKPASEEHPELESSVQAIHEHLLTLINLDSTDNLGDLTLNTLDKLGLKGAIHWHQNNQTYSSIGPLSDLESVLLQQAKQTFPLDDSARYLWGSANLGAIIHNMPSPKSAQYKTMRQLLLTLFSATDKTLEKLQYEPQRTKALSPPQAEEHSHGIDIHFFKLEAALEALEEQSETFLGKISKTLQEGAADKNIGEHERQLFHRLLNQCIQTRIAVYDQCLETQAQFSLIKTNLENAKKPTPA